MYQNLPSFHRVSHLSSDKMARDGFCFVPFCFELGEGEDILESKFSFYWLSIIHPPVFNPTYILSYITCPFALQLSKFYQIPSAMMFFLLFYSCIVSLLPCNKLVQVLASWNSKRWSSFGLCGSKIQKWLNWVALAQCTSWGCGLDVGQYCSHLDWAPESAFKMVHFHGCWQETPVSQGLLTRSLGSLLHGPLIGLLEGPHDMATSFPQNKWFFHLIVVWFGEIEEINACVNILRSGPKK